MTEIKKKKDGGHDYPPFEQKLGQQTLKLSSVHCRFDCGCVIERNNSSGGPEKYDPFGLCPYNPKNPNAVKKPRKPRQKKVPAAPAQQAKEAHDENVTWFMEEPGTIIWLVTREGNDDVMADRFKAFIRQEKFGCVFGPAEERGNITVYPFSIKQEHAERCKRWLQHNGAIEKQTP